MNFGFPTNLANRLEVAYYNLTYVMTRIKGASTGVNTNLRPDIVLQEVKKAREALDLLESEALAVQAEQRAYARKLADEKRKADAARKREAEKHAAKVAQLVQYSKTPGGAGLVGLISNNAA